jgi:hypothetical protein
LRVPAATVFARPHLWRPMTSLEPRSGISLRALARIAGVSVSTASRASGVPWANQFSALTSGS